MGYDLNVLDVRGESLLRQDELDMFEWRETVELAQKLGLPLLSSFPEFYGEDREFSAPDLPRLIEEVDRVQTSVSAKPEVVSAVAKVRRLAEFAMANGGLLSVVPD